MLTKQEQKDQAFLEIKLMVMASMGYSLEDMNDETIEMEIHAEAIDVYYEKYGEEHYV